MLLLLPHGVGAGRDDVHVGGARVHAGVVVRVRNIVMGGGGTGARERDGETCTVHAGAGDSLVQTVGHDGVWMGRRVEMPRVGMGNVHGLKTKWVQVEESVSRKGGVLLIVVADHFISGIEPDSRSRCRCSPNAVTEEFGRLKNIFAFFQSFPAFPLSALV